MKCVSSILDAILRPGSIVIIIDDAAVAVGHVIVHSVNIFLQ